MKKIIITSFILAILACSCSERKNITRSNTTAPVGTATADSIKISQQKQ